MKNYVIKLVALLVFTSVAISSCSLEYRQRHGRGGPNHDNDRGHDRDHHYDNVHHY